MFVHDHSRPLGERTRERILRQGHLYRGTNSVHLEDKTKRKEGYYGFFDRLTGHDEFSEVGFAGERGLYFTCTSINLFDALFYGVDGLDKPFYKENNAKPILLSVTDLKKYLSRMCLGLEFGGVVPEIEIKGRISLDDIVVVDSLPKLLEVCPHATKGEIDFFRENYMGEQC